MEVSACLVLRTGVSERNIDRIIREREEQQVADRAKGAKGRDGQGKRTDLAPRSDTTKLGRGANYWTERIKRKRECKIALPPMAPFQPTKPRRNPPRHPGSDEDRRVQERPPRAVSGGSS
jgi:hypothetical protein